MKMAEYESQLALLEALFLNIRCILTEKQFLLHITGAASPLAERVCGICEYREGNHV